MGFLPCCSALITTHLPAILLIIHAGQALGIIDNHTINGSLIEYPRGLNVGSRNRQLLPSNVIKDAL